jgi:hypothetical protein
MWKQPVPAQLLGLFLFCGSVSYAAPIEKITPATLQVTILDDNGSLVHTAHVYIFSQNKKQFYGTRDAHGITAFDLPAGDYRVYAALTLKTDGIIDHYSSPEARVRVTPDEPTSVILSLQRAQDREMVLSDTARQKMGLDDEVAKYAN